MGGEWSCSKTRQAVERLFAALDYSDRDPGEVRLGLAYLVSHKADPFVKIITCVCRAILAAAHESVEKEGGGAGDVGGILSDVSLEAEMQSTLTAFESDWQFKSLSFEDVKAALTKVRSFAGRLEVANATEAHWKLLNETMLCIGSKMLAASALGKKEFDVWSSFGFISSYRKL